MRIPRTIGSVAGTCALALSLVVVPCVLATPITTPHAVAPASPNGPPVEIGKIALADTSVDGPALWTDSWDARRVVIAWAGTDAAHHLNVMTSSAGVHFSNKMTLAETSATRPAVARLGNTPSSPVAIAWTGTDPAHHLNVLYDVYGPRPQKLTLPNDTSAVSPALTIFNGDLMLAWTGTDSGRRLNILPLRVSSGLQVLYDRKVTLWSTGSATQPSLSADRATSPNRLILSWGTYPNGQINTASSMDGATWSQATPAGEWTLAAPAAMGIALVDLPPGYDMPPNYLAWTGIDPGHSLNVQWSLDFPSWPNPALTKAKLPESALGAPAFGFIGGPGQVLLAWTAGDASHRLTLATIAPWPALPCTPPEGVGRTDPSLIARGNTSGKRVTLSFDAGGEDGVRSSSLLDTLKAKGVRSTWFLEGEWTQDHPGIVQRVVAEGHEIGNHTVAHPDLTNPPRSSASICAELGLADQIAWSWTGKATRPFFRPPYGAYTSQVLNTDADFGYRTVYWTIDPRDWDPNVTAQAILSTIKQNLQPGAIILMHAGSLYEPEALGPAIDYIRGQGYSIVPLSVLLT